ncbi:hypothetical protein EV702DRAFT_1145961 [Suillus placidus]|uniref:Uncharacterized protein n=1 Tax=Suillus placidus TaxID=48579 RepID=A0A9P7CWB4_9AGAM|nr:hypothetical protein EV702DRAFT_1145961 [Suillus placidus]
MTTRVSTTLGWVDASNSSLTVSTVSNWGAITASLPVISRFPGLVSTGLSSNTVYDTPKTSSVVGYATVNATTITLSCGLLPNVTYSRNDSTASAPFNNGNSVLMTASPPWTDQIQVLQYTGLEAQESAHWSPPAVLLMVSTLLEIEPSVQKEVAVPMIWKSLPLANQSIEVYFMQCSLSTNNTAVVIDTQTNTLQNPMPVLQPSTQWQEIHQWTSTGWSAYIGQVLADSGGSGYQFGEGYNFTSTSEPSIVDEYIMTLVGLNLTAQYLRWAPGRLPVSNFTLRRDKLEAAIAQTVAQLTWMAGRMGSDGGIQPGEGMALVDEEVIALRLNLIFATSASVIMLGLALHTTGAFHASHDSQAPISNAGALQLLWLGRHSASVHEALQDVDDPTEANLRRAGMVDVCFASTTSDEEELPTGSLIDGLSVQESTVRDDGMSY